MKSGTRAGGFTLLELAVTLAIIAVVGAAAVLGYQRYTERARGTEIVEKFDAIRTGVAVRAQSASTDDCAALAQQLDTSNFDSKDATLSYRFEPVTGGFRPVLNVCAKVDTNGATGVKAARGAQETLAKNGVVDNAFVSESVVSYSLRLTPGNQAYCKTYTAQTAEACGTAPAGGTSKPPAVAGGDPQKPPVVAGGDPQKPAPRCVPTPGQKVTRQVMAFGTDLTGYIMSSDTLSSGVYSPERTVTETVDTCKDNFLGDCSVDFAGMCDDDFVKDYCGKTCGLCTSTMVQQTRVIPASNKAITEFSTEITIVGAKQVAATGVHGATILSYASPQSTNEFAIWNPDSLTITFQNREIPTKVNVNDGRDHRITTTWSSDTGALTVYDNGKQVFQTTVNKGGTLNGGGKLVLAQDQDTFGGGFEKQDAYQGQIVSASVAFAAPPAQVVAAGPLHTALTAATGLETSVIIGPDGRPRDITGKHTYTSGGSMTPTAVPVDTGLYVTSDCK